MMTFADFQIEIPSGAAGPEIYTSCPKCSDQRKKKNAKCLSVNVDKRVWPCNHCGWVGGLNRADNKPASPTHWSKPQYRKPDPRPSLTLPQQAIDFFNARGITEAVLVRNRIDFGRVYMPQVEDHADAIIFPFFRNGEVVNRKYRTVVDKHFRLEPGCERVVYGLDDIDTEKPLVWTEGEMDKLALEVVGFRNVISVPNGAPAINTKNYESLFSFIDADKDKLQSVKSHILAVDSDATGRKLEDELSRRLGVEKCSRVRWSEGIKDANEMLIKHGVEDVRWYIDNAELFPIVGAIEAFDVRDEIIDLYDNGNEPGENTGWRELDKLYTVRPGELTVVTGIPSSGKSNFIDALMVNLARRVGWRFAVFSPENLPLKRHVAAVIEKYIGKPFADRWKCERMSPTERDAGLEWANEFFDWIMPSDEDDWTVKTILQIAGQLCLRKGIRGILIDPWNELEAQRPSGMTETEYISQTLKRVRVFARQRKIHVWIVVHPSKLYRNDNGKYPVPSLYDCSGSAHWRNKADNGIVVHRELAAVDDREVQIHVQKIRFRDVGKRGMATLIYDPVCATYSDRVEPPEQQHWSDKN